MSKLWNHLEFDESILGFPIGRINADISLEQVQSALKEGSSSGIHLMYWSPESSIGELALSQPWFHGALIEQKVVYHVDEPTFVEMPAISSEYQLFSVPVGKPSADLVFLAFESGQFSRFRQDISLTTCHFERLYTKWAKNVSTRKVADEVFGVYHVETKKLVGFVALKIRPGEVVKKNIVNVILMAIDPKHRRKGLATALMRRVMFWAMEHQLCVQVATQSRNECARKLYESIGMREISSAYDFHCWLPACTGLAVRANVPYITNRERKYLKEMFTAKTIESNGVYTEKCTQWLCTRLEANHVILNGSATAALDQAALILNIVAGDEVIVPSFTFVSTANAFALRGATIVFVDVDLLTLNMNVLELEKAITPKTKVICCVHYAGVACDMDSIMRIANASNIVVVEDAAQAFLSSYKGRALGTIGHLGVFSFHYTKNVISGEGGALCINDRQYLERALISWEKGTNRFDFIHGKVDKYYWVDLGSSFVPNELMAVFLLAQLEDADAINRKRICISHVYHDLLSSLIGKGCVQSMMRKEDISNGHIFWVLFETEQERDRVQLEAKARGVQLFSHYVPLHSSKGGEKFGRPHGSMCVTDLAATHLLRLPLWNAMTWQHVFRVVSTIFNACKVNNFPKEVDVVKLFYSRK
jgi:dTDP-4-amino-4,6-dideoxygalactose transaminase